MDYGEIRVHAKAHSLNVIIPGADEFVGKEYYDDMRLIVGVTPLNFKERTAGYEKRTTVFIVGDTPPIMRQYLNGITALFKREGTPFRHTYSTNTVRVG